MGVDVDGHRRTRPGLAQQRTIQKCTRDHACGFLNEIGASLHGGNAKIDVGFFAHNRLVELHMNVTTDQPN